ncbi:hypothetical protein ACTPEM_26675, partial [Clostridioides difficile]
TLLKLHDGTEFKIRASAGISWYPDDSTNYDELMRYADFAMYQLINKTKVQVKINKSDLFKDMKLVEIKKSDSSYQEIYELEE